MAVLDTLGNAIQTWLYPWLPGVLSLVYKTQRKPTTLAKRKVTGSSPAAWASQVFSPSCMLLGRTILTCLYPWLSRVLSLGYENPAETSYISKRMVVGSSRAAWAGQGFTPKLPCYYGKQFKHAYIHGCPEFLPLGMRTHWKPTTCLRSV